jgi:hypothetical protein
LRSNEGSVEVNEGSVEVDERSVEVDERSDEVRDVIDDVGKRAISPIMVNIFPETAGEASGQTFREAVSLRMFADMNIALGARPQGQRTARTRKGGEGRGAP